MNSTKRRAEILSVILALSAAATAAMPVVSDVSATNAGGPPGDDDPNRNLWGKEASELAQAEGEDGDDDEQPEGSEMGEHSRESDATPNDPGRLGIGNLPGHPSESIEDLCGEGGEDCPEAIAD